MQPAELVRSQARVADEHWVLRYGKAGTLDVPLPRQPGRVFLAGVGKAVVPFGDAVAQSLGERLAAGLLITKTGHAMAATDPRIVVIESSHPVPDERSEVAARSLEAFVSRLDAADLLIFLVTGGASALLAAPVDGITLADKQAVTRLLIARGADIHAINTVRRHLSRLKGGGLLRRTAGAQVVTLAVSDVIGDAPESIGSGLTVADRTTFVDALAVARQFGLDQDAPAAVMDHLRRGAAGDYDETLKPGDRRLDRSRFHIIARLDDALQAAAAEARAAGLAADVFTPLLQGPVEDCAMQLLQRIDHLQATLAGPWALIAGGEPEVVVRGNGSGGRNQHLALLLAGALDGRVHGDASPGILVAGTDGTDGPTNAAGAFVDTASGQRAGVLGLDIGDHLARSDSGTFFERLGDRFVTGPTGTNVMDLLVAIGAGRST